MSKPTLIFAPGAWYPSSAFDPLIAKLAPHGYTCQTVSFPSIQQATEIKDLTADINAVRALVEPAVNAGQDVIIISHSWSGLPVNSALEGLSRTERQREGKQGGVTKLIFISAFLPDVGESLIGAFGGVPPEWYVMNVSFPRWPVIFNPVRYMRLRMYEIGRECYSHGCRSIHALLS